MSLLYTFDVRGDRVFNIYANASFVSNTIQRSVKHCIEGTFNNGSKKYAIGFSNNNMRKVHVSYMGQGKDDKKPHLIDRFDAKGNYSSIISIIDANEGDKVLVCFDSSKNMIYSYSGKLNQTYEVTIANTRKWRVFVGSNKEDNVTSLSLNVGFEPFSNKIPKGFSSWIKGMIFLKQSCYYLNKRSAISKNYFIILILERFI